MTGSADEIRSWHGCVPDNHLPAAPNPPPNLWVPGSDAPKRGANPAQGKPGLRRDRVHLRLGNETAIGSSDPIVMSGRVRAPSWADYCRAMRRWDAAGELPSTATW